MQTNRKSYRVSTEINAGSMADIAFLLLIFFLVATTIATDKGIKVILPKYYEGPPGLLADRNVLNIKINSDDKILIEGKYGTIDNLSERIKDFVLNETMRTDRPLNPEKAVISLQNDVKTSYDIYTQVYARIQDGYYNIWEHMAQSRYGENFKKLSVKQRKSITTKYPMKISEAEAYDNSL